MEEAHDPRSPIPDPRSPILGFATGLLAAAVVVRVRCSIPAKAIVCGLVYGPGLLVVLTSMNGRPPTYGFAVAVSVLFGLAGVATAVATAMATRILERPSQKPASA
jgi:peptidoglycan/LPS O-acetylase OafA/YrhL